MDVKSEIKQHAQSEPDKEVCGIIFLKKNLEVSIVRCRNIHPNPESHFRISIDDILFVKKNYKILAIYHSHPGNSCNPSDGDILNSEENGYPMYIYSTESDSFYLYRPSMDHNRELNGRPYVKDINSCFSCVLDFYIQKFNPKIDAVLKESVSWSYICCEEERFQEGNWVVPENHEEANERIFYCINNISKFLPIKFEEVDVEDKILENDLLLIQPPTNVPFHIAVISKPDVILQHRNNHFSLEEFVRGAWLRLTKKRFKVEAV